MVSLFLLLSSIVIASGQEYTGTVTSLEAPIFSKKDIESKVIYFARKGEILKVHPHYFNNISDAEQIAKLGEQPDPLFKDKSPRDFESRFYLILLKNGQEAYIPKQFFHLNYNDIRELKRQELVVDPTDYRIKEPLPEHYPIKTKTGYRGSVSFAIGNSAAGLYNFKERINSSQPSLYKDLNVTWSRRYEINNEDYIFYGGLISVSSYEITSKHNSYDSSQKEFSFGIGPRVIYDPIKYSNSFFSIALGAPIYFVKNLTLNIENSSFKNERIYKSFSVSPQLDITYTIRNMIHNLDLIIGSSAQFDLLESYTLESETNDQDSLWSDDDFTQTRSLQLSYFIGLQSNY